MKQFKKVLAFVLALAMVVTAVPTADAKAAAKAPKLNNYKKILYVGQSYTLKVNNLPANWKKCTYAWSTSNKNVTVKKGKYGQAASIKAVKASSKPTTVTVKMTYPQTAAQKKAKKKTVKTFKCAVTVKNPSVKFTTTADRIEVGETAQFTAKATPSTAKVTYSSSDAAVATVDATGLVTAVADGTATIKATAKVGTKTVTATKSVEVYTAPTEAKQTKVKEITITSGKVVTKDSKIEVKKGSVEVAPAEKKDGSKDIAIDATGKTVVITTAAKLTKGEYTVTIDGVVANFTAEDEKVSKIEFLSDKAVLNTQILELDGVACPTNCGTNHAHKKVYRTAKAAYKVYNQFNEDVTDATNVELSGNGVPKTPATKGEIVFTSQATDGFRLNDIVAAVVIYNNNGVAVTKSGTFTVSNEAAISEITIKDGVYNKKGEAVTLTEDTDLSKGVYLLVSAKDQYGNTVTKLQHDSNVLLNSAGGLTNLKLKDDVESEEITVDGVKYAGFKLEKEKAKEAIGAGTATFLVISKGTGVTVQGTVAVANGGKVDTISIQLPDLVVGGEKDNKLGYTALDSYGKEVTSVSGLAAVKGIKTLDNSDNEGAAEAGDIYVKENPATGKAELYYWADNNTKYNPSLDDYDVESLLTPTYKSTVVNITIRPNAIPTAITGTDKLTTGALAGENFVITKENIKVADQYGRTNKLAIGSYNIFAYFPDGVASNKTFDVANGTAELFKTNKGANLQDAETISKKLDAPANPDTDETHKAKAVVRPAGENESSTKVRFVLTKAADSTNSTLTDAKVLSTYDVTFTSSVETNIVSYEVADIGSVYCGKDAYDADGATPGTGKAGSTSNTSAKYSKDYDVKGVTSEGIKVTIPKANYTVTATGIDKFDSDRLIATAGKITSVDLESKIVDSASKEYDQTLTKQDTAEVSLTFTFKDGKQIEKKVTLTKDAPKVKEVKIKKDKEALEIAINKTQSNAYIDAVKTFNQTKAAVDAVKAAIQNVAKGQTLDSVTLADDTSLTDTKTAVTAAINAVANDEAKYGNTLAGVKGNATTAVGTAGTAETGAAALTAVKDAAIPALTAGGSAYKVAEAAVTSAISNVAIADIYAKVNSLIEAKDQYGVDIAQQLTAGTDVNVTISNAKDAAGNDNTFTNVTNNGKAAAFGAFTIGSKADVKLVFNGGFVFTAKIAGVEAQ